jgi:hypothetical protein
MEIKPYEIEGVTLPPPIFPVNSFLYPQHTHWVGKSRSKCSLKVKLQPGIEP